MIKKIGIFMVMTMMLALAACSVAPAAQAADGAAGSQAAAGTPQPGQGTINTETKLLIGTLNLEGTGQAVTKEQAAQLLPLWKAVKSLTASQTSSQEEIDALYTQIEGTLSAEQNKAIDDMQISFQSMGEVMQKLGITPEAGNFGARGTQSPEQQATREARIAQGGGNFQFGGGGRDGGPGGQGFVPGGGQDFVPGGGQTGQTNGQAATAIAGRIAGGGRSNPALLDALINLLTERAG